MTKHLRDLIEGILTQPTAPFRESWVKRAVQYHCGKLKMPLWEDKMGNLWVNARNQRQAAAASLVFVAHMDHPGIVLTGFSQKRGKLFAHGRWLGGGPMDIRSCEVQVFSDVNALMVFNGVVRSHTRGVRGPDEVEIEITASRLSTPALARAVCTPTGFRKLGPWGACLWYRREGVEKGVVHRKGQWVTKAADDLIGVCAMIEGLRRARSGGRNTVLLLTRAEESGFHGTLHVLKQGLLNPQRTLMVSVETSAQLPGARPGEGPVVRLGDRATIFDPALVFWLQARAAELAHRSRGFRYQRRVMDGGTCEATAFNCFGFRVAGISTPLIHYHNQADKGPRPAPEAVDSADVERLAELIAHLIRSHKSAHARRLTQDAFGKYTRRLLDSHRQQMRDYFARA